MAGFNDIDICKKKKYIHFRSCDLINLNCSELNLLPEFGVGWCGGGGAGGGGVQGSQTPLGAALTSLRH